MYDTRCGRSYYCDNNSVVGSHCHLSASLLLSRKVGSIFLFCRNIFVLVVYLIKLLRSRFFAFIGIVLFPIDIGYALEDHKASETIKLIWDAIYWFTFYLSWVHGPIMSEYWASGEFTPKWAYFFCTKCRKRFKESLWVNASFYIRIIIIVGVAAPIFIIVSKTYFSFVACFF